MRLVALAVACALLHTQSAWGGSFLVIDSEPGDLIGFGQRQIVVAPGAYFYSQAYLVGETPSQSVAADEGAWYVRVDFGPATGSPLVAGVYEDTRTSSTSEHPALFVQGAGWCFDLIGRFVIHEISTDAEGNLLTLSMDFEGACPTATGGFHGVLRYRRGDLACSAAADTTACDDENSCTIGDACQAGQCIGVAPTGCPTPGQCQAGMCNPLTGVCDVSFAVVNTLCNDGDPCTPQDFCFTSYCFPGPALSCDDFDPCTTDACAAGTCLHAPVECPTSADPCQAPVCRSDFGYGCGFEPIAGCCHDDTECDDDNLCTADACDPGTNRCTHTPLECWLLEGTSTTTVSGAGQTVSRRSRFRGPLVIDEGGRYRLPDFAGCDESTAFDEIGRIVPGPGARMRLVPDNLDEQRAALRQCSPPLRLRRRTGHIREITPSRLRGGFLLRGTARTRGIVFGFAVRMRFDGSRVEHSPE